MPSAHTPGTIYLLHYTLRTSRGHQHYLGWSEDPVRRWRQHRAGRGAQETRIAVAEGAKLIMAQTWSGTPGARAADQAMEPSHPRRVRRTMPRMQWVYPPPSRTAGSARSGLDENNRSLQRSLIPELLLAECRAHVTVCKIAAVSRQSQTSVASTAGPHGRSAGCMRMIEMSQSWSSARPAVAFAAKRSPATVSAVQDPTGKALVALLRAADECDREREHEAVRSASHRPRDRIHAKGQRRGPRAARLLRMQVAS